MKMSKSGWKLTKIYFSRQQTKCKKLITNENLHNLVIFITWQINLLKSTVKMNCHLINQLQNKNIYYLLNE